MPPDYAVGCLGFIVLVFLRWGSMELTPGRGRGGREGKGGFLQEMCLSKPASVPSSCSSIRTSTTSWSAWRSNMGATPSQSRPSPGGSRQGGEVCGALGLDGQHHRGSYFLRLSLVPFVLHGFDPESPGTSLALCPLASGSSSYSPVLWRKECGQGACKCLSLCR